MIIDNQIKLNLHKQYIMVPVQMKWEVYLDFIVYSIQ